MTARASLPRKSSGERTAGIRVAACLFSVLLSATVAWTQEPPAPQAVSRQTLQDAIDKLGALDYDVRSSASRTIRRTPPAQAVAALLTAVAEHADGYVRFRALVLLTGFNDSRTNDAMRESLKSPNDRLRTVAYGFLERNPTPAMVPELLAALEREHAEFVRPALVRALAAVGSDVRVRTALTREVGRGEDLFRSVVIEALGDYKGGYGFEALLGIAKQDGPLLDDAALALGKIGDKRALDTLAGLQRSAPQATQPYVAAGICLLGSNCDVHEKYLIETLKFADSNSGFRELGRAAAAGLGALTVAGRSTALDALLTIGIPSHDPTRAPIALALGTVALRNTPLLISTLAARDDRPDAITLLAEGFDMLEEDLAKERFFAFVRRSYWDAPERSPARPLMETLIQKLDF